MQGSRHDWQAYKGTFKRTITARENIDLRVSCTKPVQVFGMRGAEKILLKAGENFRFLDTLRGFSALMIKGPRDTEYGFRLIHQPRQQGEANSGEKPPVLQLPEPSNLVQQFRRMQRDHHVSNRSPVLEPEDGFFRSYELDEDEDFLFEEEIAARNAAEAKARKEAEAEAEQQEARTPPERLEEPPSENTSDDPPPLAEAAE